MKNICRNIWFSLASIATISACIFLFCLFSAIIANIWYSVKHVERTVGITVLFEETLTEAQIQELGETIRGLSEIETMQYTSAEEAWENFQKEYFKGHEELAAGFAADNPLAGSASFTLYLKDIASQESVAAYVGGLEGVRLVNYSSAVMDGLNSFNTLAGLISGGMILVLLAVAVFLISNTISVAAAFRKTENEIMRMIGATNFMIRMPFVVEGIVLGLFGAAVPLAGMYILYRYAADYITAKFRILSDVIRILPADFIFPYMAAVALGLGVGIGFAGSFFTIRRHLRV